MSRARLWVFIRCPARMRFWQPPCPAGSRRAWRGRGTPTSKKEISHEKQERLYSCRCFYVCSYYWSQTTAQKTDQLASLRRKSSEFRAGQPVKIDDVTNFMKQSEKAGYLLSTKDARKSCTPPKQAPDRAKFVPVP